MAERDCSRPDSVTRVYPPCQLHVLSTTHLDESPFYDCNAKLAHQNRHKSIPRTYKMVARRCQSGWIRTPTADAEPAATKLHNYCSCNRNKREHEWHRNNARCSATGLATRKTGKVGRSFMASYAVGIVMHATHARVIESNYD